MNKMGQTQKLAETGRASLTSAQLSACKVTADDLLFKKKASFRPGLHTHTRKERGTRTYGIYPVWATSNSSMSWLWSPKSTSGHLLIIVKEEDSLITADIEYPQINTPQSAGGGDKGLGPKAPGCYSCTNTATITWMHKSAWAGQLLGQ